MLAATKPAKNMPTYHPSPYATAIRTYQPLNKKTEATLLARWRETHDSQTLDKLVRTYLAEEFLQ